MLPQKLPLMTLQDTAGLSRITPLSFPSRVRAGDEWLCVSRSRLALLHQAAGCHPQARTTATVSISCIADKENSLHRKIIIPLKGGHNPHAIETYYAKIEGHP